jgi:hypothetical protein
MRVRSNMSVALAAIAVVGMSSVALAAVAPRPSSTFFYVHRSHFSITLVTGERGTRIKPGTPASSAEQSLVLVVCPASAAGSVSEALIGFPGAQLKIKHGRYRFTSSYSWTRPRHNIVSGPGAGTHTTLKSASVNVSGTVSKSKLITGTLSVKAAGCDLPSSHFRAGVGGIITG